METKISLWISDEIVELLNKVAKGMGLSRSDVVRYAINQLLIRLGYLKAETFPLEQKVSSQPEKEG